MEQTLFNAGFVQNKPRFLDARKNTASCLRMMRRKQADLWVLPELFASGYGFKSREELAGAAEEFPSGPTCSAIAEFARERNCAVVFGFPERSGGRIYNSAAFISPSVSGIYRKTHLFWNEKKLFSPGDTGFRIWEHKGVKIGVAICFDWMFPESCRKLAADGAQIIAHPSNLVKPWGQYVMRARSVENMVYTITANRIGSENGIVFTGGSQIIDPAGEVVGKAPRGRSLCCVVGITPGCAVTKMFTPANDIFKDRRPEFY